MLDVRAAAIYLGIGESFLNHARVRGDGPPFVKIGRCVRYRRDDLDCYVAQRLRASTRE
jgi:predicted DNA-binding transcriptional regulator AlpA